MVLKQKTSVQEVSLLINQEHEILYGSSNLIFSIYLFFKRRKKMYSIFIKGKCLQYCLLNISNKHIIHKILFHIKPSHF